MKYIKAIFPYVLVVLFALITKEYIFSFVRVNGPSMEATLHHGDLLFLKKYKKDYKRFDLVVLKNNKELLIKRIIALPNEIVEYKDNELYINNKKVEEDFLKKGITNIEKIRIPKGTYYLLGDNREHSYDSRYIGPINKQNILGITKFRLYPFNKIKLLI